MAYFSYMKKKMYLGAQSTLGDTGSLSIFIPYKFFLKGIHAFGKTK